MAKLLGVLFLAIFLEACERYSRTVSAPPNDTAKVLQLALRTAFLDYKLPEIGPLFRGGLFNDSVFVVTDSFPRRLLPATLDTIKFKFGSYEDVTSLLRRVHDSLKPNYLYICCFEKMDSVYSVSIQSRSPVRFGGGGSTEIDIVKRGDSMVVKQYSSNSIN
jgi:hypothetical protein